MKTVFAIIDYKTSRDYDRLADLMQTQSAICIIDYNSCRDVAHTIWIECRAGDGIWEISSRGISYIYAVNKDDFIQQCCAQNVEVIFPGTI
jgi:hypothetical protein